MSSYQDPFDSANLMAINKKYFYVTQLWDQFRTGAIQK
jgi:hypothetical protein